MVQVDPREKITSEDIIRAIRMRYGMNNIRTSMPPEWSGLEEFSLGPGGGRQRADMFLVRSWSSAPKRHERITIEIKVSRTDLLKELARPHKIEPFAAVSHRVYFAVAEGVVKDTDNLGEGVGLYVLSRKGGSLREIKRAKRNNTPDDVPEGAFVEAMRRASKSEWRHKDVQEDVEDLPAQIISLQNQIHVAQQAQQRAVESRGNTQRVLKNWMTKIAEISGVPCMCGVGRISGSELRDPYRMHIRNRYDKSQHASHCAYPQPDFSALVIELGLSDERHIEI
jgi:hypothetical protein